MIYGASEVIRKSINAIAPVTFFADKKMILHEHDLAEARRLIEGAANASDGITQGLIGLGSILSMSNNALMQRDDVNRLGWLMKELGESLEAYRLVESDTATIIRLSLERAQCANEKPHKAAGKPNGQKVPGNKKAPA